MKKENKQTISGNIVDVIKREIYQGTVYVKNGKIDKIEAGSRKLEAGNNEQLYILPGLIDAHIHIESSMVIPSEFARAAVIHGTVAAVTDPHEIANVLGIDGVKFMIDNGKKVNFKFYFGAPSCVPATDFETSGSALGLNETEELLEMKDVKYLSEMMNFPGVLNKDINVINKIELAKKYDKPTDGHAPGLTGDALKQYISAGISTDHECFTIEEAREKIKLGMKILIREGSAAKNFDTLIPLIKEEPEMLMLCSDDKHPDDLVTGHINMLVKRAIDRFSQQSTVNSQQLSIENNQLAMPESRKQLIIDIIRSCTYNPVKHYNLDSGLLQEGDAADFIVIDNLKDFNVLATYINGQKVAENKSTLINSIKENTVNNFYCNKISVKDIEASVKAKGKRQKAKDIKINVIEAIDGQLVTNHLLLKAKIENNKIVSDIDNDILKIVVVNRYKSEVRSQKSEVRNKPAVGFIKGFGLKSGAIASSIAHDSHNIIAVGAHDKSIVKAINRLIGLKGGIAFADDKEDMYLPLPVAGIMSNDDIFKVADKYKEINKIVNSRLSTVHSKKLNSPYMTLSFMALLVIPELKISDKGLFDVNKFRFISLIDEMAVGNNEQ